jgi:uncharacterized membrane protein YvbJ
MDAMKRCRFCGGKILDDASQCEHCGKTLRKSKTDSAETPGITNLDSWENKSVPSWLMYAVVGFLLVCAGLVIYKGCQNPPAKPSSDENASMQTSVVCRQA